MTKTGRAPASIAWYTLPAEAVASRVGVDPDRGLDGGDAVRRLGEYGPNQLPSEPPLTFGPGNLGLVVRHEREPAWSRPVFPFLGWIILGWILTWAAVELHMLQRLLDTTSLTGGQWLAVLGLSLVMPAAVGIDKIVQLRRLKARPNDQ